MTDEVEAGIGALMKRGAVAEAAARLSALLSSHPDDDVAKLLYGTCAQLLGDDATFGRIHAELRVKLEAAAAAGERSRRIALWEAFKALAAKLAMPCMAIASSVILCGCYGCPPTDPDCRPARDGRAASAAVPDRPDGDAPAPAAQPVHDERRR